MSTHRLDKSRRLFWRPLDQERHVEAQLLEPRRQCLSPDRKENHANVDSIGGELDLLTTVDVQDLRQLSASAVTYSEMSANGSLANLTSGASNVSVNGSNSSLLGSGAEVLVSCLSGLDSLIHEHVPSPPLSLEECAPCTGTNCWWSLGLIVLLEHLLIFIRLFLMTAMPNKV